MPALAQIGDHALIVALPVAIEHQHDDRRLRGAAFLRLAEQFQRRIETRHADREAGGRYFLAGEARDEIVIAPAAADGAEAHELAVLVARFHQQFAFEDGTGVIFETANHG